MDTRQMHFYTHGSAALDMNYLNRDESSLATKHSARIVSFPAQDFSSISTRAHHAHNAHVAQQFSDFDFIINAMDLENMMFEERNVRQNKNYRLQFKARDYIVIAAALLMTFAAVVL